jgi:cytidine deaminase
MKKIENDELIEAAKAACGRAYAPYSNFRVGAALVLDDGKIITGCNVENASYGLTICAERAAVFTAIAAGAKAISRVAVAVESPTDDVASLMPCGACLQVLSEFMPPDGKILIAGNGEFALKDLFLIASRSLPVPKLYSPSRKKSHNRSSRAKPM